MWIVSNAVSDILDSATSLINGAMIVYEYDFNYNLSLFWVSYIGATSTYTILGVNLDRTFCIKMPMKAYTTSKKRFWISIILCWVLALVPAAPYLWDSTVAECAKHCSSCWLPVDNVSMNMS